MVEPSKLYDSPFKKYHSMGIRGVFSEKQADSIFEIVTKLNPSEMIA